MPQPTPSRPMPMSMLSIRRWACATLSVCSVGAVADPAADGAAQPIVAEAPLQLPATGVRDWSGTSVNTLRQSGAGFALPRIQVVEVPADIVPGTGPRKLRHALSIRAETPQRMLRSMGFEASECATRIRVPSHFKTEADGSRSFSMAAHLGLACKF